MGDIVVLAKPALNPEMIRATPDGLVDVESVPLKLSDIDRNALEEASKLRQQLGGKVIAVLVLTWGPVDKRTKDLGMVVQEALAKGADEAYVVADDSLVPGDPATTASAIVSLIKQKGLDPTLILAGEATIDGFSGQVAGRVAAKLGIPFVSYASKIDVQDGRIVVERDLEDEVVVVETELPAVVSVTREINQPRPPTLLQIRRAARKPQHKVSAGELGDVTRPKREYVELRVLTVKRKQTIIEGDDLEEMAEKLIEALVSEGVISL